MRTIVRIGILAAVALVCIENGMAQALEKSIHVFPQIVDGRAADGTSFRTTLTVMPWATSSSPSCSLSLYGMTADFNTGASGYYFTAVVPPNSVLSAPTRGQQALQSGYGVLVCSDYVYASVILSYYAPDQSKIGEATVLSSTESAVSRMPLDVRGGVRQSFAIANDTDFYRGYWVSLSSSGATRSVRVVVPPRRNLAKWVHDILPVGPDSVGVLTIQSEDFSLFSAVGFRFNGSLFTIVQGAP